ncbi:uncharacterized protein DUF2484 [Rhodovulum imhoffii]|uniref:Uncharacterized protein DUF2484 n=1 Tax=Rhodovulum imhoffii TaxID=365340 RepID=A0A2T5BPI1_9RHOB|nr:DUF2484 family protein [Rhodovulum imhoffii]MBK5932890.1 hypothetical protein [Rhodovulum imhoffii]PTN00954.1 uncharacterized protein DUF2484 [Rhodovulum imhoffii]
MNLTLGLAILWGLVALGVGVMPEHFQAPLAFGLVVVGVPLIGLLTYQMGPVWGLAVLIGGVAVLRLPKRDFIAWIRQHGPGAGRSR